MSIELENASCATKLIQDENSYNSIKPVVAREASCKPY